MDTVAFHVDPPNFSCLKVRVRGLINMENSSASHHQGVLLYELLPLELRRTIYTFAAISVPLIKLRIDYYRGTTNDNSGPGRVRLYTDQDFRMLATNREFRKEISDELYVKNS